MRKTLEQRLYEKLFHTVSGCAEFQGARDRDGYGKIRKEGRVVFAHRVAWELIHGPIPAGKQVLHKCDNEPCCNHDHLYLGVDADNTRDRRLRDGIAFGPRNGKAKLTDEQAKEIRDSQMGCRRLARLHSLSVNAVVQLRNGTTWKHLPPTSASPTSATPST